MDIVGIFSDGFDKILSLEWTNLQFYMSICLDVSIFSTVFYGSIDSPSRQGDQMEADEMGKTRSTHGGNKIDAEFQLSCLYDGVSR